MPRRTPLEDLVDDEAFEVIVENHIDLFAHLLKIRWSADVMGTGLVRKCNAICLLCREVIAETHWGAKVDPVDHDALDWDFIAAKYAENAERI